MKLLTNWFHIFEYTRNYLAAFVEGQFIQIHGLTRTACEIWLKNGLPIRESLAELYFWFFNERGNRKERCDGRLDITKRTFL